LTIGGWEGSRYFSNLVATVANRTKFANTVKSWVDQYGFTSVSFDWEFIGKQGAGNNVVRAADAANLIKFFTTLRTTLGSGVTIAADVPAGGSVSLLLALLMMRLITLHITALRELTERS